MALLAAASLALATGANVPTAIEQGFEVEA
jgi:hypothetical protein